MIIVCAAAALICAALLLYIYNMKKQLRTIRKELEKCAGMMYNRFLTVSLFDNDINELAAEINRSLDNQKRLKIETERAENALRRSVSDIAHDLRTPLSVIKGDLQLIDKNENIPPECREYITVCLEKTDTLKNMADEFFELAVLESDMSRVPLTQLNITNLLMRFIADNEGLIRMSGLEPVIDLPPAPVYAMADEAMLMRILGNLLSNTVKYASGSFEISLGSENGCVVTFSNRMGINRPDPHHIFERTYRADKTRSAGSAGIGLYIVKLLAEKQGASVFADTDGDILRIGAVFEVPGQDV